MDASFRDLLWKQFGASIDMLENAVRACPPVLWDTDAKFWYRTYHTLFFLDYYLDPNPNENEFQPPSPFTLSEFNEEGEMPERTYTKDELLKYLNHCRQKCHDLIAGLTEEKASARWITPYRNYSILELLLYNMRHVQHHTGQLNYLLRKEKIEFTDWVSRTKIEL